jgi:hypothetical protein
MTMLATSYPGGGTAIFLGMGWLGIGGISLAALVLSLPLLPFGRTFAFGRGLSWVALWGGWSSVALAAVAGVLIALDEGSSGINAQESLWILGLTVAIPVAALGLRCWCRQKPNSN